MQPNINPLLFSSILWLFSALLIQCQGHPTNITNDSFIRSLSLIFLSISGYFCTIKLIPSVAESCLKSNLFGRDINKTVKDSVPESLGIATGGVYIVVTILFQPIFNDMFVEYNAALISICFMLFLGFADDVLDLRWRVKIFLSILATLPLLVAYTGPTNILVPKPFRIWLPTSIDLGFLYYLYMSLIGVFCTNSINIYAGINGLEVGQSIVIACAVLVHNYLELAGPYGDSHYLSIFLMLPFLAVSLALFAFNFYPSKVFVGDSYTYFAGITFAVTGIMGHFSKTMLMFFAPQLLNFAISLPQLFKIMHCPRHRVPKLDTETGLLNPSYNDNGQPNLTVINGFIHLFGPTHERTLVIRLIIFQILCCMLSFAIRYSHTITDFFYESDNELANFLNH